MSTTHDHAMRADAIYEGGIKNKTAIRMEIKREYGLTEKQVDEAMNAWIQPVNTVFYYAQKIEALPKVFRGRFSRPGRYVNRNGKEVFVPRGIE